MTRSRSDWPSDCEVEIAFALLGRLISRGNDPRLDHAGLIHLGGPVSVKEQAWAREHREAFRAALVGSDRYIKGSLDRLYGLGDHAERQEGDR